MLKDIPEGRRIAKVLCSFELLSAIFSGDVGVEPGFYLETNAPSDLKVIGIAPGEHGMHTAWLYCESKTFPLMAEGFPATQLEPFEWKIRHKEKDVEVT